MIVREMRPDLRLTVLGAVTASQPAAKTSIFVLRNDPRLHDRPRHDGFGREVRSRSRRGPSIGEATERDQVP